MRHNLLRDFIAAGSLYLLLMPGLLFLYMALAPAAGFIPYSANAGWHFGVFEMESAELYENAVFMARWARMLILPSIFVFAVVFALIRVLENRQFESVNIAFTGGILSALLSGLLVNYMGWYILIHISGVVVAFFSGFIFGTLILPAQRLNYDMVKQKQKE